MSTLILGSTGFIAGSLARFFEESGHAFRAVGARELDLTRSTSVSPLAGLLRLADSLAICSALTPEHGRDTFERNVAMMKHICAALTLSPCAQVVYLSSDAVDDPADHGYGQAHRTRERMLESVCEPAILRPCAVYGAGDAHNAYGPNRFVRSALASGTIQLFGKGEERRDHLAIDDLVQLIARCVRQRTTGVLNAVTGRPLSFRRVAEIIAETLPGTEIESLPRERPVIHRESEPVAGFEPVPPEVGIRALASRALMGL